MSEFPYSPERQPGDVAAPEPTPTGDYDEAGVPTLEHVRDKIEGRPAVRGRSSAAALLAQPEGLVVCTNRFVLLTYCP